MTKHHQPPFSTITSYLQSKSIPLSTKSTPSYYHKKKEIETEICSLSPKHNNHQRQDRKKRIDFDGEMDKREKSRNSPDGLAGRGQNNESKNHSIDEQVLAKIKFKRFSRILKQKYLFFNDKMTLSSEIVDSKTQSRLQSADKTKMSRVISVQPQRKPLKNKKIFIGVDKFPSKLKFKHRPSSGVPLKHHSQILKTRERVPSLTLEDNHSLSIDLKHIQVLTYADGFFSTKSSKLYSPQKEKCIYLKKNPIIGERRKIMGIQLQNYECIEPWVSGERSKNVSQMDISVKLPH